MVPAIRPLLLEFGLDLFYGNDLRLPGDSVWNAGVAQLVEHKLPKLGVAGSNPVARSKFTKLLSSEEDFPFRGGPQFAAGHFD